MSKEIKEVVKEKKEKIAKGMSLKGAKERFKKSLEEYKK